MMLFELLLFLYNFVKERSSLDCQTSYMMMMTVIQELWLWEYSFGGGFHGLHSQEEDTFWHAVKREDRANAMRWNGRKVRHVPREWMTHE
jgi:hypothetical protein